MKADDAMLTALTADLQSYWNRETQDLAPTQYPGQSCEAGEWPRWFEFWMTEVAAPAHRAGHASRAVVWVDIHCFARGADLRAAERLADRARERLSRRVLTFPGSGAAGDTVLRLREAVIRDLGRETPGERRLPLRRLLVSCSGRVEYGTHVDAKGD